MPDSSRTRSALAFCRWKVSQKRHHVSAPRYYRIKIFILFALACTGLIATAVAIAYTVLKDG